MPYTDPHDVDETELEETSLVKRLREEIKQRDRRLGELEKTVNESRADALSRLLKEKGIDPKVVKFVPEGIRPTEDDVTKWLESDGDVFKPSTPPSDGGSEEDAEPSSVDPAEAAEYARLQEAQGAGQRGPAEIGTDKILSEVRALQGKGSDATLEYLRAQGLLAN